MFLVVEALIHVVSDMFRWHRAGWRLFWRLKSRPGRPPIPKQLQALIGRMANENPSWGEERIANELLLKLGIRVSPRTVRKYWPHRPLHRPRRDLRWSTILRLHAQGLVACEFVVVVTATLRLLYVFVMIEHGSRRLIHFKFTAHPTSAWTLQQLREVMGCENRYPYLLHDRDSIFAEHLDASIARLGVRVLKLWTSHYNTGRPHMALGSGVPDPPPAYLDRTQSGSRHRRGESYGVRADPIVGGLHHEYSPAPAAA